MSEHLFSRINVHYRSDGPQVASYAVLTGSRALPSVALM